MVVSDTKTIFNFELEVSYFIRKCSILFGPGDQHSKKMPAAVCDVINNLRN